MREELITEQIIASLGGDVTSDPQSVAGARKISLWFVRAEHTTGNTAFSVEVSFDGNTWVAFNRLVANATNDATETLAHVASATLSSNTTELYGLDLTQFAFPFLRVKTDTTTDGVNSVWISYEI